MGSSIKEILSEESANNEYNRLNNAYKLLKQRYSILLQTYNTRITEQGTLILLQEKLQDLENRIAELKEFNLCCSCDGGGNNGGGGNGGGNGGDGGYCSASNTFTGIGFITADTMLDVEIKVNDEVLFVGNPLLLQTTFYTAPVMLYTHVTYLGSMYYDFFLDSADVDTVRFSIEFLNTPVPLDQYMEAIFIGSDEFTAAPAEVVSSYRIECCLLRT